MVSGPEIFILSLVLEDGSPFVTSVSQRSDIRKTAARHHASETEVSHWRQDGPQWTLYSHPLQGWRLQERYVL